MKFNPASLRGVLLALLLLVVPTAGNAQKLATTLLNLYGPNGLFVQSEAPLPDGSTHSAHFNSAFQSEFAQFNVALGTQISTLPIPSPSSGFTYEFDPSSGAFTRTTDSFGSILADRAETIGKGRYTFGFNYQFFSFDEIHGLDLGGLPAVFTHDGAAPGGKADVVTTTNRLDIDVGQTTAFFTWGVTDRIDLSVAVPFVNVDLAVTSDALIQRLGTGSKLDVHFYTESGLAFGSMRRFESSGSASGIGDVALRLKARVSSSERVGIAAGLDVRLPTGDEEDLLGSGAESFEPFFVASMRRGRFSPHLNLSYQFNGDSPLAGDIVTGTEGDLPDQFSYAIGADIGVSDKLTLAFDVLGNRVIDGTEVFRRTFTGLDDPSTELDDIGFREASFWMTSFAAGAKINPVGNLLIDFNLLFQLDDGGLRDELTPLIGIEYSF